MDTSPLDHSSAAAPLRTSPYPSVPIRTTREPSSSRPSTTPPAPLPSTPSIPSTPSPRDSSTSDSPPAPADALRPPSHTSSLISHTSQKLAELLKKAGSLSASPETVQAMINLGAPADDIVKFTAWLEGKLNGTIQ